MRIKKLIMHNFGVYAATNILEFKGDKPVVLIGGMNGRGKTTILEAILLGLYGANSFAYTESKYATYGQYLKSYVNKADGSLETFVELEFSMNLGEEEIYYIRREWSGKSQRVHEKINVKKNGESSKFLTENWSMFVENILPSALSSFFFFDGEKIAELAVEDSSEQMKKSIKAMLGITVLDVLQGDIGKIISKISKENEGNRDLEKLEQLRMAKEMAEETLNQADIAIENEKLKLEELQSDLEKLKIEYTVKGGRILEQKDQLMRFRAESLSNVANSQEQLLELVSGEMPLVLVKELMQDIHKQAKIEHEQKINLTTFDTVKKFYDSFDSKSSEVSNFIAYIQATICTERIDEIYGLSDMNLYQIDSLNREGLQESVVRARELMKKRDKNQKKVDEIDNSLSVDINENVLKKLFNLIRDKNCDIAAKHVEIERLERERTNLQSKLAVTQSEYSKYVECVLSVLESADSDKRTLRYSHMAIEIIKLYRIRLQEKKTDLLAKTMTECYKKLSSKKNLVDSIKMDSKTLDLHYMNSDGEEIAKKRLSAGEKQLMVVSLLWALAICSKKKLPVIIDTPLSRLDSVHRQALIKIYFPQASDQTIILSTDSEIDERYYGMIKKSIGDEFTLNYNDKEKRTTIKHGYFGWR